MFKIPTLTETFIYFNDDFLLNNYIDHDDIIDRDWEIPILLIKTELIPRKVIKSGYQVYITLLTLNKFNYDLYFLHHSPFVFWLSNLQHIYNALQHDIKCIQ